MNKTTTIEEILELKKLLNEDKDLLKMYDEHRQQWEESLTETAITAPEYYLDTLAEKQKEDYYFREFLLDLIKIPKREEKK